MISSGSCGGEADREGVDPGEGLENDALGFGERDRRFGRTRFAAEDIGAVGQDGDGVAAAGEVEGRERILVDREAGLGHAGGVDEGEDGAIADRHLRTDADQPPIAPPVIEPCLLELRQGRASCDWLDRGGHTGHATVPGFDLLAGGGFARACHQTILRLVAQSAGQVLRTGAFLLDLTELKVQRL